MARIVKRKPFEAKTFTVSATTFKNALSDFRVEPTGRRKKGYGYQYFFTIDSWQDYNDLIDHMAVKAADLADVVGAEHPHVQDIYNQLEHI
jgi:hypothetical protein